MEKLAKQLQQLESLAATGKLGRFLHAPSRYISAQYLLRVSYPRTRKGMLKQVRTFFGADMEVLLPAATDIFLTGGKTHDSEIRLVKYMIKHMQPGQTYIDIGAHFGYFSLLAATLVGENGKVYAFEAAKNTVAILKKNTANFAGVKVFHNAVSDKEETIKFYEFPILYSEYNSMDIKQFSNEGWMQDYKPAETEVIAVSLDKVAAEMPRPDYIKIDVEGAEDKVIRGGKDLLNKYEPVVIMEFLSEDRLNIAHSNALQGLNDLGYKAHIINKNGKLEPVSDVKGYLKANNIDSDNIVFVKSNKHAH